MEIIYKILINSNSQKKYFIFHYSNIFKDKDKFVNLHFTLFKKNQNFLTTILSITNSHKFSSHIHSNIPQSKQSHFLLTSSHIHSLKSSHIPSPIQTQWRKWGCLDWDMLEWMCEESLWEFVNDMMVVREFYFFLNC